MPCATAFQSRWTPAKLRRRVLHERASREKLRQKRTAMSASQVAAVLRTAPVAVRMMYSARPV